MKACLLIILFKIINLVNSVNYCNLCSNHIACDNNEKWATTCPKDAAIVKLSTANIETLLHTHNHLRDLLAGGKIPGYKSASRMNTLKWDSELAFLAELNVKQCKMNHDKCRKTEKYPKAGQNLYYTATTGNFKDIKAILINTVNDWFDEYKLTSQASINKCCGGNNLSKIGHFLQVAQDQAVAVGCAVSKYTNGKWKTTLVACNYSYGNILNTNVYKTGSPASACPNGKNSVYSSLCK